MNERQDLPKHYRFAESYDARGAYIYLITFTAVSETRCGYWVVEDSKLAPFAPGTENFERRARKYRRFVHKSSARRYCYPDKRDALASFCARKRRQIMHATMTLQLAKCVLQIATEAKSDDAATEEIGSFMAPFYCGQPEFIDSIVFD